MRLASRPVADDRQNTSVPQAICLMSSTSGLLGREPETVERAGKRKSIRAMRKTVPKFDELIDPTLQALKHLGGSGSIDEIVLEIVKLLGLPPEIAEVPHGTSGRTELEYRSAWARTYLRNAGFIENSERGVWALTPKGTQTSKVDGRQIARDVARQQQAAREAGGECRTGSGHSDVSQGV